MSTAHLAVFYSLLFDGAIQYGEIPDSDLFSPVAANGSGFTISFWVNWVRSAANVRIINKAPLTGEKVTSKRSYYNPITKKVHRSNWLGWKTDH